MSGRADVDAEPPRKSTELRQKQSKVSSRSRQKEFELRISREFSKDVGGLSRASASLVSRTHSQLSQVMSFTPSKKLMEDSV